MTRKEIGDLGEDFTARYLEERGCEILCRNFRIRGGEIDIIAKKGELLHIVEVKSRKPMPLTSVPLTELKLNVHAPLPP